MNVVIIEYNAGNIRSVDYALRRMGVEARITNDHDAIRSADKVIFPGVGEASTTMRYLKDKKLDVLLKGLKQPVLGICLGLQLMCRHSEEGNVDCIGIFEETVKQFIPKPGLETITKVPQMGWNNLTDMNSKIFADITEDPYVYFVHSFYAEIGKNTAARCEYINPFSASLHKDNFYATQFHPEKSGKVGALILKNFIAL